MGQKKRPYVFFILLLLLILAASYYIGGLFCDGKPSLLTLETDLMEILSHPFRNYWNDKSAVCLCTGLLGWMYFLTWYSYHNRDFMFGREHGSAKWEDAAEVSRRLRDLDPKKNRVVSKNLEYSIDALPNNNMLVIGSPGTGKTAFLVMPNLLRMLASYIILDVKGDLLYQYGSYLKAHGYQIRVLNLKDKNRSDCYNPFAYMRSEEDVIRAVKNIQEATAPPDAHKGEPFWEDGAAMYMKALFCYVLYELPPEERNMGGVVGLTREEMEVLDEEKGVTRLSLRMERLKESPQGIAHPAYVNYKKLKEGAPETVASLVLIVNTKLQLFEVPEVKRIFERDTLHLRELGIGRHGDGRTKTALFLVLPDADTSFHFIAALLYSQVMETLLYEADHRFHGKLPIPVEFWMDEYANGARPWRFENLITTFRSRNMAAVLFVQSISQLKYIHKGDSWGILMDACSAVVFLGAGRGSLDSQEYISKLLGSGTIDKRSEGESRGKNGGSSLNFDRLGRELLTAAEVGSLDRDACLILLAGCGPVRDWKNKPFALPAFLEAQALPRYEHPVYVRRTSLGDFITLQPDGTLEELSPASVAYYRKRKEEGENIQFLTIDEDRFQQIDFLKETEIDLKTLSGYFLEHADDVVEAEKKALLEEEKDMSGSIFACLDRYRKVLAESQIDAILSCLEAGLPQEMVKGCFFFPAERIQEEKRIALLQRKQERDEM